MMRLMHHEVVSEAIDLGRLMGCSYRSVAMSLAACRRHGWITLWCGYPETFTITDLGREALKRYTNRNLKYKKEK